MSRRIYEIAFEIGGRLQRSLNTSMVTAAGQLNRLDDQIKSLNRQKVDGEGFSQFNAGIDQSISKLRSARNSLREVQGAIDANMQRRSNLRGQLVDAVAIGASLVAFTSGYRDLQQAQGELATLGVSEEGLVSITQQATNLSNQMAGVTVPEFIRASYDIRSGIESLSEAAVGGFTEMAAVTAEATKSSVGQMTNLFAVGYGIYRQQFGQMSAEVIDGWRDMSAEEQDMAFGEYFSAGISRAVQQFRTDGAQMQASISALGAGASNLGVEFEEQLAILGTLQQTMSGSESATRYRAFLSNVVKAGESLELQFTDANGQLRDMPEILNEIRGRYGETITALEKAELAQAFGTQEAVQLIDILIQDVDGLSQSTIELGNATARGAEGTREMAAAAQRGREFELMQQRLQNATTAISQGFLPAMLPVVEVVGKAATRVGQLAAEYPLLTKYIGGTLVVLAGLKVAAIAGGYAFTFVWGAVLAVRKALIMARIAWLLHTGAMVANTATSKAAIIASKGLAAAQWVLNAAMRANPIGLVVTAIAGLVAAGVWLWKNWDTVAAKAREVWGSIPESVRGMITTVTGVLQTFSPIYWIVRGFSAVKDWFSTADWSADTRRLVSTVTDVLKLFNPVYWIMRAFTGVYELFSEIDFSAGAGVVIGTLLRGLGSGLLSVPRMFTSTFTDAIATLTEIDLSEIGANIMGTLTDGIKNAAGSVSEAVSGAFGRARELMPFSDAKRGPFSDLTASGSAIMSTLASGVNTAPQNVLTEPMASRMQIPAPAMGGQGAGASAPSAPAAPAPGRGSGITMSYAPTINLPAGSAPDTRAAAEQALQESQRDFERRLRDVMEQEGRVSYA